MLWLITCDLCPTILFMAEDFEKEALDKFQEGMRKPAIDRICKHPSFKLRRATLGDITKLIQDSEEREAILQFQVDF